MRLFYKECTKILPKYAKGSKFGKFYNNPIPDDEKI